MKRIPLILSLALLLLLPAIALYPMLHASAEKDGVDSSTAIQEAAPSEAGAQQQALHRYMTAYYTTLGDLTDPNTDGVFCADDIAAYEQAVGNDPSQSRPGMILCILGWK